MVAWGVNVLYTGCAVVPESGQHCGLHAPAVVSTTPLEQQMPLISNYAMRHSSIMRLELLPLCRWLTFMRPWAQLGQMGGGTRPRHW